METLVLFKPNYSFVNSWQKNYKATNARIIDE